MSLSGMKAPAQTPTDIQDSDAALAWLPRSVSAIPCTAQTVCTDLVGQSCNEMSRESIAQHVLNRVIYLRARAVVDRRTASSTHSL